MKQITIIIPVYNAKDTIKSCIDSIYNDSSASFQLILIDDGSSDGSIDLLNPELFELYRHENNKSAAIARNTGIKYAKGNIILFLDSDIIIQKGTLAKVVNFFADENKHILVGNYTPETPVHSIFSQYKNLWIHESYKDLPHQIHFLFTSCTAIRRNHLLKNIFHSEFSPLEDFELGYALSKANVPIYFSNEFQVTHIKNYTFLKFIKNEFIKSFSSVKLFQNRFIMSCFLKEKRIGNINFNNCISPFLTISAFLLCFGNLHLKFFAFLLFLILIILNISFFHFVNAKKGFLYSVIYLLIFFIDNIIFFSGIVSGIFIYVPNLLLIKKNISEI